MGPQASHFLFWYSQRTVVQHTKPLRIHAQAQHVFNTFQLDGDDQAMDFHCNLETNCLNEKLNHDMQGFEWAVHDVQKLRNFVEEVEPVVDNGERPARSDLTDFEILRQSPMIGDHKFKLEIGMIGPCFLISHAQEIYSSNPGR